MYNAHIKQSCLLYDTYPCILDIQGYVIGQCSINNLEFMKNNRDYIIYHMNAKLLNKITIKEEYKRKKKHRLVKNFTYFYRYNYVIGRKLYFATFTFSEDHIDFNRIAFRKYLQRTCKLNFILYHDYGEKNGRFHLHGFVSADYELNNQECNKFGFVKFQRMNFNSIFKIKKAIDYTIDYSIKTFNDNNFKVLKSITYKNYDNIEKFFERLLTFKL